MNNAKNKDFRETTDNLKKGGKPDLNRRNRFYSFIIFNPAKR